MIGSQTYRKQTQSEPPERFALVSASISLKWLGEAFKRAFDLLAALVGLIILTPVFVLIAILIKRDSPGPTFYWGSRVGKNRRLFKILKFRTMYDCPDSFKGPRLTCKDDQRVTPLGKWLRDTKINELPQLFNVLIGDMSLVGPRPEDPEIMLCWSDEECQEILSVRPGITSPASILYHDEEGLLSNVDLMDDYFKKILPDKIRLDRLYVRYHSFVSDLDALLWTLVILIPRIYKLGVPEGYLFSGPITRLVNRYVSWFIWDFSISFGAAVSAGVLWRIQGPLNWGVNHLAILALFLAFLFSGINALAGLNRIVWDRATADNAVGITVTSLFVTLLAVALNYFTTSIKSFPHTPLPVTMIFTIGLMSQLGFIAVRYRLRVITGIASRWLTWRQSGMASGERVLICGSGEGCEIANWLMRREFFRRTFSVIGIVEIEDPTIHGMQVGGCTVLGGITELSALIEKNDIGVILMTSARITPAARDYILQVCQLAQVRLILLEDLLVMLNSHLGLPASADDNAVWGNRSERPLSLYDNVTGFPNRYLLQDRLEHSLAYCERYNSQMALVFINLLGFKAVRNSLRHTLGDEILADIANRFAQCIRACDTLARTGDGEFALILENISGKDVAEKVGNRFLSSLSKPFLLNGSEFKLNARINVCVAPEKYIVENGVELKNLQMVPDWLVNDDRLAR